MIYFYILIALIISPLSFATRIDVYHPGEEFVGGISRCTVNESNLLSSALNDVRNRAMGLITEWPRYGLSTVKTDYVTPENRIWIEGSQKNLQYVRYWDQMKLTFQKIAGEDINMQCEISSQKICRDGQVLAYVKFFMGRPLKMIHICPELFKSGIEGIRSTLFHEMSHYTSSTEDYAMEWWNVNNIDLEKGARDAYHLERFMNQEAKPILKSQIWMWWWPKPKSL